MIDVQEITRDFPAPAAPVRAVDRLSFRVASGEVYGLLGPNGAGKTTTLRMILGLLPPTSGEAVVGTQRVTVDADAVKRQIGLVSASSGLYQWLSPRETLSYFADLYGMSPQAARAQTERLVELFELSGFLDRRCSTLSTGQKQRVTLARALMHDPPVMLLDEPTRGLDIVGTHAVFEYVSHLRQLGKAVVLCTHRLDEARQVCDRIGLLHGGRLQHEGTFAELQQQTGRDTLYEMFLQLLGRLPVPARSPDAQQKDLLT